MKLQQPLISIIMPCGKDLHAITSALVTLDAYFAKHTFPYELIILPYTTTAHVKEVLHRFTSIIPHAHIQEIKGGHEGLAIQKGMLEARGLIRIYMTPVCASSICAYENIEQWFRKGYDIVVGSRIHASSPSLSRISFFDRGFQWVMRHILVSSIHDADDGWVAYSQKSAIVLFPHTVARTTTIIRESLILAQTQRLKVKELCVETQRTSVSRKPSLYLKSLLEAVHVRVRLWLRTYALKKPL